MTSVWLASVLNLRAENATVTKPKIKDINITVIEQAEDEIIEPHWLELLKESSDHQ